MKTTLISFLGRAISPQQGSYRSTAYSFGDGSLSEPAAFFGFPLRKRIAADRMVIMGTSGSMWDHLFEGDIAFGQDLEEARLRLVEATERKAVEVSHLEPLQAPLAERLGCAVDLVIIPYCRTEQEQVRLLAEMAARVDREDTVHIDVSHGFRHLPMLGILAALHLRIVRRAEIAGIWYAAYDPDTGEATVHDLKGLLRIADWIQALHTYDKDGDYGVFAPLLGPAGSWLRQASFHERTTNPVQARAAITSWVNLPNRFPADDPAVSLFREELEERVRWYRLTDRAAWEKELALRYLEQRDYVRCAIYGVESVLSADIIRSGKDPNDSKLRKEFESDRQSTGKGGYPTLKKLRNALAHGGKQSDPKVKAALGDEAGLKEQLKAMLERLLGPSTLPR